MEMTAQEKATTLLEDYDLCDHCLGRQFARLGYGMENWERGLIIRDHHADGKELTEESFSEEYMPDEDPRREPCGICNGLFTEMETYEKRVLNALDRYEFATFLIGSRPPAAVVEAEEALWEAVGIQWVEPIKSELNRLIGKRIGTELDAEVDFERPDVNAVMDIGKDRVELQVNSMFVHGRYNKYARDLPQTKWPCGNCRGKGCDECDWTGKQYQESVEELIAQPFLEETRALETKFHGAGREDVDARCLGKREFVLEIMEPQVRDIDVQELQDEVNDRYGDKIEVFGLEFTDRHTVEAVKSRRADKTYRALVTLAEPVTDDQLETLQEMEGTIKQATPTRVEHRRADKVRKRDVQSIAWKRVDDAGDTDMDTEIDVETDTDAGDVIELTIKAAAGTYIKELISGDAEKTNPSVSQVLGTDAECVALDVIDFHYTA